MGEQISNFELSVENPETIALWLQIQAGCTCFCNLLIGCPLALGLAHYEKYGGDPQKRLLNNQLISYMILCGLSTITISCALLSGRVFFGPLGPHLAGFFMLQREFFGTVAPLTLSQVLTFKCLALFNWSLMSRINENFIAHFICSANFLIGGIATSLTWSLEIYLDSEAYAMLSGTDIILSSTR